VQLRFDQLLSAERAIADSTRAGGDIPYRFEGALEFSPGRLPLSGPVRVPLEFSGTLPLRQALKQVLSDPRFLTSPDPSALPAPSWAATSSEPSPRWTAP
jgi:hypothetical protein